MGGKSAPAPIIIPPAIQQVEEKQRDPDVQVTAKKKRDKSRSGSASNQGLNRFLITPSSGSGVSVPE